MYGLGWGMTAFSGVQMAKNYYSGALGMGFSMGEFGAVSLDAIHSRSQMKGKEHETGNAWRVRYNKSFEQWEALRAASYQYSSEGYYTLYDVLKSTERETIIPILTIQIECAVPPLI